MRDMALTSLATLAILIIAFFVWYHFSGESVPVEATASASTSVAVASAPTSSAPKPTFQNSVEEPSEPSPASLPKLAPEEITPKDLFMPYQLRLMDFNSRLKLTSEQQTAVMAAMYEQMRQGVKLKPEGEDPDNPSLVQKTFDKILTSQQKAAYQQWLADQRE